MKILMEWVSMGIGLCFVHVVVRSCLYFRLFDCGEKESLRQIF